MKSLYKKVLVSIYILFLFGSSADAVLNTFYRVNPDNTVNIKGNYAVAGNTVMCLTENTSGYGGTCQDGDSYLTITSNMHVSKYLDIDGDSNTWNSTSSYIDLPDSFDASDLTNAKKGVVWAGLFWQGRISDDKDYEMHYGVEDNGGGYHFVEIGNGSTNSLPNDLTTIGANRIKLKVDSGFYSDINANTFYTYSSSGGTTYAAFADVTNVVRPLITTSGKHVFTVANLTTNEGREPSPGVFGGWSLVVIYAEDYRGDMRNISVYNGFDIVANPSDPFTITNFILPKENSVNASLSLFSGEGEYLYGHWSGNPNAYDWVKISPDGTNYDYMPVPNNLDEKNIFDGRFSGVLRDHIDNAYNDLTNNNDGVDVDTYDVSDIMTQYRDANPNLNTLYIQWASNNDYITPSMLVFATQIYEPKFCYDYAYKQYGRYFTEENDGTHYPRLKGSVFPNVPVDVKIYLKNQIASDLTIENMQLNVVDINTSQAKYNVNVDSVKLAKVGELIPQTIDNSQLNVADSYIKNIPIGNMGANDYFYLYYSLDPVKSSLDMPLGIEANYNLVLSTDVNVSYSLRLGPDIPMCSSANFDYSPAKGIFNIVHNDYYNLESGGSNGYYNIPTQVADRVGDFKVLSFDPNDLDQLKTIDKKVVTFVEMIDASAFHDVNASCEEMSSAITDRYPVVFENSNWEPFNSSSGVNAEFYKTARRNTAFRVSYNANDNGDLLEWQTDDNVSYYITNFPSIAQLGQCKTGSVSYIDKNGNSHSTDQSSVACGNANSGNGNAGISMSQVEACERCIYGYHTRVVCSRDNFAIRPEAFLVKLNDQNQTTGASEIRIADDITGNTAPSGSIVDLAAGYNYDIEINATNFIDNNATPGYTAFYNDVTDDQYIMFKWEPRMTVSNCNDENNATLSLNLYNGKLLNLHEQNASVDNVGEYRLTMYDKSWTAVDWNSAYMKHHSGSYFLSQTTPDCIVGSSVVPATGTGYPSPAVGCDITSNHDAVSGIKYRDYNVTLHPYKFDLSTIASSTGLNDANATTNNFVYNANMDDTNGSGVYTDLNMSYHIYGNIEAKGQDDSALTNFVAGCYAKDIGVTLPRSAYADTNMTFKQSLETLDQNGSRIGAVTFEDANNSKFLVFVPQGSFVKQLNGKANVRIRYNFARDISQARNPQQITFNTLSVDCNNTAECQSIANASTTFQPTSTKVINDTIYFYYARAHAPKMVTNGPDGTAKGYYEVYCYGSGCNKNYLPDELAGGTSSNSDDPRWWINTSHSYDYGKIKTVSQKRTPANVSATLSVSADGSYTNIALHYNGSKGYPYRAIMKIVPDKWLIYNKYDANADHNEFEAQFNNDTSAWIGSGETQDATETKKFGYKDRALTW